MSVNPGAGPSQGFKKQSVSPSQISQSGKKQSANPSLPSNISGLVLKQAPDKDELVSAAQVKEAHAKPEAAGAPVNNSPAKWFWENWDEKMVREYFEREVANSDYL